MFERQLIELAGTDPVPGRHTNSHAPSGRGAVSRSDER
jgi:hypothetical protein